MDLYDRRQTMEESQSDPQMVWTSQTPETGLEESMWTMGLGSRDSYPERPGEPNCNYYMRTGTCGYGGRCRFNHPRDRSVVVGAIRQVGEYPEREGQPECEYFLKTGTCKFGASCKYHHPKYGGGSMAPVSLNYFGYPLRPGEKECSYYVKTGQCKFSVTCKFHHPQPAGASVPTPAPTPAPAPAPAPGFYPSMQSPSVPYPQQYGGSWQPARPALLPGSFMQGPYGSVLLSPGMVPVPTWSPFQAPMSPVASPGAQPTVGGSPLYGLAQLSPSATAYPGPYQPLPPSAAPSSSSQNENMFPERPGKPECPFYMNTGHCKFGPICRYHHPQDRISPKTNYAPSPMGLPSRPGAPTCTFYMQHGVCKYGPACKFDHPMGMLSYSPSASSLADMPVAPYPIGSSLTTLAPSSSSSDLRQEFIAGSNKESLSTRMSSSENTSSGLVGSNFSQSGSVPHSNVQLSGQISTPSRGSSSSTGNGSDIHTST